MPFRVAADVLRHLLPADVGMSPETLRAHTLKIGKQLCDMPTTKPVAAAMSITVTTGSTFNHSCEEGNRLLEFALATSRHPTAGGRSSVPSPDPTPTLRCRFAGTSRQSAEPLP
jgi:hypothetical protein